MRPWRGGGWLPRPQFLDMLALTNLIPGPNSSEMAIHIGWARAGRRARWWPGLAFLLPSFMLMVILSALYFAYGTHARGERLFLRLKPVAVALVAQRGVAAGRTAAKDWLRRAAGGGRGGDGRAAGRGIAAAAGRGWPGGRLWRGCHRPPRSGGAPARAPAPAAGTGGGGRRGVGLGAGRAERRSVRTWPGSFSRRGRCCSAAAM